MRRILLRPAARTDVEEIWRYSEEIWGPAQAERYLCLMRDAFVAIADGSRTGRPMHGIRPGYLKLAIGSHFICYRITEDAVDIVRVLHQRMDIPTRLQDG